MHITQPNQQAFPNKYICILLCTKRMILQLINAAVLRARSNCSFRNVSSLTRAREKVSGQRRRNYTASRRVAVRESPCFTAVQETDGNALPRKDVTRNPCRSSGLQRVEQSLEQTNWRPPMEIYLWTDSPHAGQCEVGGFI